MLTGAPGQSVRKDVNRGCTPSLGHVRSAAAATVMFQEPAQLWPARRVSARRAGSPRRSAPTSSFSTSSTRPSASSTSGGRSRCSAASWPRSSTSRPTPHGQSKWQNFNFADWTELSASSRPSSSPTSYDWIHTVRFQIAVPRIIRLLGYDKLPRQDVKFNRRNIYARDGNRCQYCGKKMPTTELSLDHVRAQEPGRQEHVGQHRLLLREVQRQEGRPHARAGPHAPDHQAGQAEAQPGDQHPPGRRAVPELEAVPG